MRLCEPLYHRDPAWSGTPGDDILIEILDSGDIKVTTDPISGPNHMAAEGLLRTIAEIAGGATHRTRRRMTSLTHSENLHTHQKG